MYLKTMPTLLVLIFSLAIFISTKFTFQLARKEKFISYSAGIMTSYLFLKLLPEIFYFKTQNTNFIYLLILLGFAIIHLTEKYIYQHNNNKAKRYSIHEKIHFAFFFLYYFLLGILINFLSKINLSSAILFTTTITLYSIIKNISGPTKQQAHSFLYLAPLLGYISSLLTNFSLLFFITILSFITGSMFYLVIRELIPTGKKGKPLFFLLGILSYLLLDFILEQIKSIYLA